MLRALGHQAIHDPENDDRVGRPQYILPAAGYNVIVEGFTESIIEEIAGAHANGARFLCIATEEPTPLGFNHGTSREMRERQEIYPEAMKYFDGTLHLVPSKRVTDWYSQWTPTAQAELGYAPSLVIGQFREPHFDFGFYGSLTPRRRKLLQRLADFTKKRDAVRLVADFKTAADRNKLMQEAKIILQVRKFDEMGLVSSSRCNTGMAVGRPIIAEPHDMILSKPWDQIVKFTYSEREFFDTALMSRNHWRALYESQFARFRSVLTPEFCIGEPLASLGLGIEARIAA